MLGGRRWLSDAPERLCASGLPMPPAEVIIDSIERSHVPVALRVLRRAPSGPKESPRDRDRALGSTRRRLLGCTPTELHEIRRMDRQLTRRDAASSVKVVRYEVM